ncbi:VCBS repeat-containing protein [bacterium]|nr:VCBS repeat-containing protein [bacterium]
MKSASTLPLLVVAVLCHASVTFAQIQWSQFTITENFPDATGVCAADFDGDGDADIIGGSTTAGLRYWENVDGQGLNWTLRATLDSFVTSYDLLPADMDSDGDPDLLTWKLDAETIVWWEVADSGSTWIPHPVDNFYNIREIAVSDIDSDGDMDVIGAGGWEVRWWENENGDGSAWSTDIINGRHRLANTVDAADIDGDGDMDVTGSDNTRTYMFWWENFNNTDWLQHTASGELNDIVKVKTGDLDGDGDIDLIGSGASSNLTWYENVNGSGDSWNPHVVAETWYAHELSILDLDGDNDLDILGSQWGRGFTWWENTSGDGQVWESWTIDDSLDEFNGIFPADFNGDGRLDVVGASNTSNTIAIWFQVVSSDDITITLLPATDPVIVTPSSSFTYSATLVSHLTQSVSVIIWTEAVLPNGTLFSPIIQTPSLPFTPNTAITVPTIVQAIPGFAPIGEYVFRMKAGLNPTAVFGVDEFPFEVVPANAAGKH